ncbi:unnamed protein product [Microthlaspi erraticum]|uniref:Retrotransposon gag domain-containing protein n=1 Tax=Microthlaspi erraticum TaxID=1685480 RepID=A0A6D2JS91_9BRAS|nr:unnamed protein product [Microthlaspi erraticum]
MVNSKENTPVRSSPRNEEDLGTERTPPTTEKQQHGAEDDPPVRRSRSAPPNDQPTSSEEQPAPARRVEETDQPAKHRDPEISLSSSELERVMEKFMAPINKSFAEIRAQQSRTQKRIEALNREDDEGRSIHSTEMEDEPAPRSERLNQETALELERMNRRLDEVNSKIHRATSSAPELTKALADTRRSPLTRRLRDRIRLKIDSYPGDEDPKKWLTAFNLAMTRERYNSHDEREANYCQVFVEHMTKDALVCLPLEALRNGLWYDSKLKEDLSLKPSTSLEDAFHRAQNYIFLEEDKRFYAEKHGDRRITPPKPKEDVIETRRRPDPKRSLLTAFAAAEDESEQGSPHAATIMTTPDATQLGDDGDINTFCKFHRRNGHATENCKQLISNLIRMYNSGQIPPMDGDRSHGKSFAPRPSKPGQREKRGRQFNPRKDKGKSEAPPDGKSRDDQDDLPPPPRRYVTMIMGGLLNGDESVSAIKKYERKAVAAQRNPYVHQGIPTISFTDRDAGGLDTPQLDPLVVTMQIHDCDVSKILIDTRRTVNLIFKETLDCMCVEENSIKPAVCPLTGFTAEHVYTCGTVRLPVYIGGISKLKKFILMEKPAIYNIILGTPWLHEMRAVISTFHQCVKFPTPAGIFTLRGNQRETKSCFLQERRLRAASSFMIIEPPDQCRHLDETPWKSDLKCRKNTRNPLKLTDLFKLEQFEEEPLQSFVDRFQAALLRFDETNDLFHNPCLTLKNAFLRAEKFIRIEQGPPRRHLKRSISPSLEPGEFRHRRESRRGPLFPGESTPKHHQQHLNRPETIFIDEGDDDERVQRPASPMHGQLFTNSQIVSTP